MLSVEVKHLETVNLEELSVVVDKLEDFENACLIAYSKQVAVGGDVTASWNTLKLNRINQGALGWLGETLVMVKSEIFVLADKSEHFVLWMKHGLRWFLERPLH